MKDNCCVFPDTNVFLHFLPIRDIDWCALADARSVDLIVCMTVIHELDAKKSDSRLAGRAERAIKEIRDARRAGAEIRRGVKVSVFNREVRAAEFPETLSPESADDRIVHLAKLYVNEHPGTDVAIATGDFGMELRASAGGTEVITLDQSLRLENPQDELKKKYQQAVSELNAIKNRLPRLTLGVALPDSPIAVPHEITFELDDDFWRPLDIESEMQTLMRKHPRQSGPHTQTEHLFGIGNLIPGLVSRESLQRYDAKLSKFYDEYRKHLEFLNVIRHAKSRSFWFDLWLQNEGKGLATDIDVFLQFPAEIRFVAEKGSEDAEPLENELEPPKPPERPDPLDVVASMPSRFDIVSNMPDISRLSFAPHDDWTPDASVHRSHDHMNEIRVQVGKLKHGHNVRLGQFVAIFGAWEDVGPFKAECTISTSELIEKIEIQLPFIAKAKGVAGGE